MKDESKVVAIFGYGSCGQYALDFMLRSEELSDCRFVVVNRSDQTERLNTSIVSSMLMDRNYNVKFIQCDFNDIDRMVEIIEDERVDIIDYCGRYISGIKYGAYSFDQGIGYGAWVPLALPYIYKVSKAVSLSRRNPLIINTSYSDAVVPILYHMIGSDLRIIGAGNVNHLVPRIRMQFESPDSHSSVVRIAGSHFLDTHVSNLGSNCDSPFALYVKEGDYTFYHNPLVGREEPLVDKILKDSMIPMEHGRTRNLMIASDVSRMTELAVTNNPDIIHTIGTEGNVGCYPSFYDGYNFSISSYPIENAVEINTESLKYDGVEVLENEVRFTDELRDRFKEVYNYGYPESIEYDIDNFVKVADDLVKVLTGK